MTELEKAARMALERLKIHRGSAYCNACEAEDEDAIVALTQALATTERKLVATPDHNGAPVPASPADMQVYDKIAADYWTERKGEPATIEDNSQRWAWMDGATAWHLIDPHADGWGDIAKMMGEWLKANTSPQAPEDVQRDAERYRKIRQGSSWPCAFASHDAPEPLTGDDLDAAIDAARKGE